MLRAGAGETLIAPLFDVIRERGVVLRAFHRLVRVELDDAEHNVEALVFMRAARTCADYDPVVTQDGFRRFGAEPDWDQLQDGEALRTRGVDFYSRFGDRAETEEGVLRRGVDFDDVVLALPLGSIIPDGDGHSPVARWLDAKPEARACIERLHLVRTLPAQLWFDESPDVLGCRDRAVATWGETYSVACDMSDVIEHERWGPDGPRTSVYMCGAWPLRSPSAASTDPSARCDDDELARTLIEAQLSEHGAATFSHPPTLHTPAGAADRWQAQYIRANVEPWDLADLALPGADGVRLEATHSGLNNMALAGSWVRTPVNTTSVEAAVCSGLAAARALGAACRPILAEGFLRTPATLVRLPRRPSPPDHVQPIDPDHVPHTPMCAPDESHLPGRTGARPPCGAFVVADRG